MDVQVILFLIVSLGIAVILHEASHAAVAFWLGDPTAKEAGRMSLNPIRHIDPVGTLLIPGALIVIALVTGGPPFLFGYAKPVPIVRSRLRNPRFGSLAVALAGPFTNLVLALIAVGILSAVAPGMGPTTLQLLIGFLLLNVTLFVFNMVPVPPLDGSELIGVLLPDRARQVFERVGPVGFVLVLFVVFQFPILGNAVEAVTRQLIEWFVR